MPQKRVLITVGGTGGHIFPALALGEQLKSDDPDIDIFYVGEGLGSNRYFDGEAFPFEEVSSGTMSLRQPWRGLRSVGRIVGGVMKSRRLLREHSPDLVVGFGSFHTLPLLLAAKMGGVPFLLHEGNTIPGRVNRLLARHAVVTGVQFPETAQRLRGQVIPVALPLRKVKSELQERVHDFFHLDGSVTTILVFGGSQGAHTLNRVVVDALTALAPDVQVIHLAGNDKQAADVRKRYTSSGVTACVKGFEKAMEKAWQAADLVIGRAGAGTLAEQLQYEVPAILIPYPHAADNHQQGNADLMVEVVGGAIKIEEGHLTPQCLTEAVDALLADGGKKLALLCRALRNYKKAGSTQELHTLVHEFLNRATSKETQR